MPPMRNINYGRGRTVAPDTFVVDTFVRDGAEERAPAFLLRCGDPGCAIRRLRAAVAEAATAAQARFLALAHHRRMPTVAAAQRCHISNTIGVHPARLHRARAEPSAYQHEPGNGLFYSSLLPPSEPRFPSLQRARVGGQAFDIARFPSGAEFS